MEQKNETTQDTLTPEESEARAKKYRRIAKRRKGKIARLEAELAEARKPKPKPKLKAKKLKEDKTSKKGFDYAEKAFLQQNDVKRDEFELAQKIMGKSGMDLDELIDSDYFRSKQKEHREQKAATDAVPEGRKRGGSGSAKSSTDYWIQKGELPPDTPENQKLRREIVNERAKRAKDSSRFSDNPVVM